MGVTQTVIDAIKVAALGEFDAATHIGVGDDATAENPTHTDLQGPILRNAFDEASSKNTALGTYDFTALVGLTEANGSTIEECGLFSAASGGTMYLRKLLTTPIAKTATKELSIGIKVTTTVTNS